MNKNTTSAELVSQFHRKNHCAFFLALTVSILTGTTGLIISWIIKELIDLISGNSDHTLKEMIIISIAALTFTLILSVLNYISEPRFVRRAMRQYKEKAFGLLSAKNISSFRDENTSTYLSALTNDASAIETGYVSAILPIATKIVSFTGSIALMLYYSPLLTAFAILIMIVPAAASAIMGKKMAGAQKDVSDSNSEFVSMLTDCLGGFRVIKSFKAEKEAAALFEEQNTSLEDHKYRLRRISGLTGSLGLLTGAIAQDGVFLFGTYLALSGKGITAGTVLMFVNLMNFTVDPLSQLPKLLAGRKAASVLIDKLSGSLCRNSSKKDEPAISSLGSGISFKDVSFSYEGSDRKVLHDINCEFLPGRSYAIVGGSGSGKSTLLNLLMSSGNEYGGSITIDDKELRNVSADSLFDIMSVIQQNVFIFNSSIRDNVTMFRDFPKEKVEEALKKAHLEELIKERGELYKCGENGKGLSGGEKQRISIARCLLKDSSILLADEATSSLDNVTSHDVINEILELESMTRIVVTHSLDESLLRRYDEILVIKDGTIKEKGDFQTLMDNDGYFKALYTVAS
ncbi:MAG: ABC transporter ATP-binding protein [Lachnospiraceae bacterium]|nr:ABC transporter ATP-binding protein [Lachnospiraceae bacterium]